MYQGQEYALAVYQPVALFEVGGHVVRIDIQFVDQPTGLLQHVVEQNRAVRKYHAFHAGMADVPLVPESDVLHRGKQVRSNDAGLSTDSFRNDRVTLVWHRRRALLARSEVLLGLKDFGPLVMANLQGHLFQGAREQGQGRLEFGVPIALDYLGGHGYPLHLGVDVGVRPHCARNLAN